MKSISEAEDNDENSVLEIHFETENLLYRIPLNS